MHSVLRSVRIVSASSVHPFRTLTESVTQRPPRTPLLSVGWTHNNLPPRMGHSSSLLKTPEGQFVTETISNNCVVIFSKTTCGFCQMAKLVFQDIGVPYTAVEVNLRDDGQKIQDALVEITGQTTVPRVFVNQKCIGGGTETRDLHKRGKLLELVKECQASNVASNL